MRHLLDLFVRNPLSRVECLEESSVRIRILKKNLFLFFLYPTLKTCVVLYNIKRRTTEALTKNTKNTLIEEKTTLIRHLLHLFVRNPLRGLVD